MHAFRRFPPALIAMASSALLAAATLPALAQPGPPMQPGQPMQPGAMQPGAMPPNAAPQDRRDAGPTLDALMAWERQDLGVRPETQLHAGEMHGPTPNQLPGGQVITTKGLLPLLRGGQMPVRVYDVLGGQAALPGAVPAAFAAQPGSFDDATQARLAELLRQTTGNRRDTVLVFYCAGPQCWMSYNAALRAVRLGYTNVAWYRGGLEAWQHAGLSFAPAPQAMERTGGGAYAPMGGLPPLPTSR